MLDLIIWTSSVIDGTGDRGIIMTSLSWMSAAVGWELPERVRKSVTDQTTLITNAIETGDSWLASERMRRMVMRVEELELRNPGFLKQQIVEVD
jgi:hypothetical protein